MNRLFVASAKVNRDLSPLIPLLNCTLRLYELNIGLEDFFLSAECLENFKHFDHSGVSFAQTGFLDALISSLVLLHGNSLQLV